MQSPAKGATKPAKKPAATTVTKQQVVAEVPQRVSQPIDRQQRPEQDIPTGLNMGAGAPVPQPEQIKEKRTKDFVQETRPQAMNADLYPRPQQQLPAEVDDQIEQYVYMESDRTVRSELTSYRKEIMEQLELFREAQKKQI